ncbi:hypothetical protein SAMN05216227_1006150 [Pseudorhodobacter antarcticus]|uniref:Uncharacterized protein n=1 Tax=Pseudorhodobacter antarcticus TaxID=1077947 RepID=A0A1H8DCY6_9RHOB|nr:hypothetical protein SAMN05216227_1006150 [Pseudorhodobacter antarcticus]
MNYPLIPAEKYDNLIKGSRCTLDVVAGTNIIHLTRSEGA